MAKKTVKAIPDGYTTITPYLIVRDAAKAIEFYKKAFGAEELHRMTAPGGGAVMHAELKIGNSIFMLSDEWPDAGYKSPLGYGGTTVSLHIYARDVDAAFAKAIKAGAKAEQPPTDMFWGDRYGKLIDPFGHRWGIATHVKDLSPAEMGKAAEAWFKSQKK